MRYTREFGLILYKTTLDENVEFKELNIRRRGISQVSEENLNKCYSRPIKICHKKKKDLLDMLPFINPSFRDFYTNLATDNEIAQDIDPDLSEESECEN